MPPSPARRLNLLLWALGMPGVIGLVLSTLPQLLRGQPDAPPLWLAAAAGIAQSAAILALAVWAGGRLAPRIGLGAPVLQALVHAQPASGSLKAALVAGLVAGIPAGAALHAVTANAPLEFIAARASIDVPLPWRVLYGGVTEELLLRWGLMSLLVWLPWRFLQKGAGKPGAKWFWSAIVVSALLFGAGHLPALAAQGGAIGASLAAYVVFANAVFGLVFGYLFWRVGLEAAMLAHAAAHVVAYLIA